LKPTVFKRPSDLRKWFEKHHAKEQELLVGYYKKDSGKPSITWPESVDEALCFGWIDGIGKSVDEISYTIRFTPRRARSIWSAAQPPSYKKAANWWVLSAKKEETRLKRLAQLIDYSAQGDTIPQFTIVKKAK
jgi:uncharacterized protein YdeI (YjbR/CyaY-like superfamily)